MEGSFCMKTAFCFYSVMIPSGIGAVITVICLAKAVDRLFDHMEERCCTVEKGKIVKSSVRKSVSVRMGRKKCDGNRAETRCCTAEEERDVM